jgi:hypothetical protein
MLDPNQSASVVTYCTDKKENQIFLKCKESQNGAIAKFLIYKEFQNGAVAKSYMTNGLLISRHFLIY